MPDPDETAKPRDVLKYRYDSEAKNKRDLDLENAKIFSPLRGEKHSEAYQAIRGAEQLHYEKADDQGVAADQIDPINQRDKAGQKKYAEYLNQAKEKGVTPCQNQ
jgi:hypothetical protein